MENENNNANEYDFSWIDRDLEKTKKRVEAITAKIELNIGWLKQLLTISSAGLALLFSFATRDNLPPYAGFLCSSTAILWVVSILASLVSFREMMWFQMQCLELHNKMLEFLALNKQVRNFIEIKEVQKCLPPMKQMEELMPSFNKMTETTVRSSRIVAHAGDAALLSFACGVIFLCIAFVIR